jgi:hypothetical protein
MAPPTRADRQTTIRLPSGLYAQLELKAEEAGRTTGEEIRLRLSHSLEAEPPATLERETRDLLVAVARMAAVLHRWFGPWWEDPAIFRVFQDAIGRVLAMRGPKADEHAAPLQAYPETAAAELFGDAPTISTVAAALVTLVLAEELDRGSF